MITEKMLDALRESVMARMSPKRFRHTAEVEKMAERLAPKGFAVDGLLLIIDGRCADCVNQAENNI